MPKSPVDAKTKVKEGDLVLLHWRDACTRGGWKDLADYKTTVPIKVQTVGWVITNTKSHITVVQTISEESGVSDSMTVPKPWLLGVKKLR